MNVLNNNVFERIIPISASWFMGDDKRKGDECQSHKNINIKVVGQFDVKNNQIPHFNQDFQG